MTEEDSRIRQDPALVADGWIRGTSHVDGSELESVRTTPTADVRDLVARARRAQGPWAEMGLRARTAALVLAAKRMLEKRQEVLDLIAAETGKCAADALMSEVAGPLDQVKQWAKVLKAHGEGQRVRVSPLAFPGKRAWIELVPRGVVGAITPWNYPMGAFYRPVLPALLAGNGVVIKPSEHAPRVARWFVEQLAPELPQGLLGLAQGDGTVGRTLIEAGIDACVFTGSVAAGRAVAADCGVRHIPFSSELGGKDAAIVLADCDVERTLAGVTHWALQNGGQNCASIERLVIEERIADTFVERLGEAWSRLRVGTVPADAVDVSPLANAMQLAVVERHVEDAIAQGAVVVCGGERTGTGLGYRPTVLDRCTTDMAVAREETFGPLVAVLRVEGADQAIRVANECDYGLTSSVWTQDLVRGEALARRLHCGVVSVNNHAVSGALVSVPWTGTKQSGPGVANSPYALSTFLRPRTHLIDKSTKPDVFWMPFDQDLVDLGHGVSKLQLGQLAALVRLPKLTGRRLKAIRSFFGRRSS